MTSYSEEEFPDGPLEEPLTFGEKALAAVSFLGAIPSLILAAVNYYIPGHNSSRMFSLEQVLFSAFVRKMMAWLPLRIIKASGFVPLREFLDRPAMKSVAKSKHNYNKPLAGPEINIRWLHETPNRTKEDPVIYYFHGGGYFNKILPSQVQWLSGLLSKLENKRVSIAILDYATIPHFAFPYQLNEAISGYNELCKTSNKIIVLGDSAGSHLVATFLFRLKVLNQRPPFGAFFISSMVDMDVEEKGSWLEFKDIDYVNFDTYRKICDMIMGYAKDRKEANPMLCTKQDWEGAIPKNSAATWGAKENLRDSNRVFFEKVNIGDHFEEADGIHDITFFSIESAASRYTVHVMNKWFQ